MADSQLPTTTAYEGGDPDPLARIGEIIDGRYRLLEFIGQGGMGNVYRGEHVTIRKPIALKLLHPSLANIPELRSRFEREAFAIGRIDHPNCVEVSDFGELGDGSLFLAMEFLDGESAADLLDRERPLAPERGLQIIRYVLGGLGHAHRVGIVHRDIKPENIFIAPQNGDPHFAKVLDFGIAKLLDGADDESGREKLTQAGITFGTPAYLSPEQALGDPADARSDLYSVAVVLFELLAGVPPFRSSDKMELLAMHANRTPPKLGEVATFTAFSPALEELVAKGLQKRPANRFQSAEEFIAAIDELQMFPRPPSVSDISVDMLSHYTPVPAVSPIAPTQRAPSMAEKRPRKIPWLLAGGGAIALLLTIIVFMVVQSNRTRVLADVKQAERSEVTKKAEEVRKVGEPEQAIKILEEADDNDPSAQLGLGHAYSTKSQYDKAIEAYTRALTLDENSIRDPDLITNLQLMTDKSGKVHFEALRILIVYSDDEAAVERLLDLAASEKLERRRSAWALAEKLGHDGKIDRLKSFGHDLAEEKTCKGRKAAVAKLRALGDPAAIKPLEEAIKRRYRKKVRGKRKWVYPNACLSDAARDAIRFLASKPKPADSPR